MWFTPSGLSFFETNFYTIVVQTPDFAEACFTVCITYFCCFFDIWTLLIKENMGLDTSIRQIGQVLTEV